MDTISHSDNVHKTKVY